MGLDLGRAPFFCWWNWEPAWGVLELHWRGLDRVAQPAGLCPPLQNGVLITVATHPLGLQEAPLRWRMPSVICGWWLVDDGLSELLLPICRGFGAGIRARVFLIRSTLRDTAGLGEI